MKKSISICLAGMFLLCLLAAPGTSLKAQDEAPKKSDPKALEIIAKLIDAMGGRKLLEATKDTTVSGSLELISMGMDGAVTVYNKEPNMMRMDIEIMGMTITQAFDGESAWMFNPQTGANEVMPDQMAEDFKRESMGNEHILNPAKHNIIYTYQGLEKIDDVDYHKLTQLHPDGWSATMHIDTKTFLTHKVTAMAMNQMGVEVEAETFTSDYKKVDGMMVAFTMTTYQDGEEFMTVTITDVKFNTGIEDSFFQMDGE